MGVADTTVGQGCRVLLGLTGTTVVRGSVGQAGVYTWDNLTVAAGGEVTVIPELQDLQRNLTLRVGNI